MLSLRGDVHNKRVSINLGSNNFFSQQTLANIVHRIAQQNPGVQLDGSVDRLISKHRMT